MCIREEKGIVNTKIVYLILFALLLISCTPSAQVIETSQATRVENNKNNAEPMTASNTPGPTLSSTKTKTPEPTSTEEPTQTPLPPRLFTYDITIDCNKGKNFSVDLNISGNQDKNLRFSINAGGYNWKQGWPSQAGKIITSMTVVQPANIKINQSNIDDKQNSIFPLSNSNVTNLILHYDVNVGFWDPGGQIFQGGTLMGGYIGSNYCVIEPALLFLTPVDFQSTDVIRVKFKIPDGWQIVTFWNKEGDYYSGVPNQLRMSKGPFAFGKFDTKQEVIDNVKVVIGVNGYTNPAQIEERALYLFKLYQQNIFGSYSTYAETNAPRDGYIAIFIPAQGSFYNLYHEQYGLYMSLNNQAWDNFAHMLSHNWTTQLEPRGAPWYLTEGYVEYFQRKITRDEGYITSAKFNQDMIWKYNWYRGIIGTKNDISIDEAMSRINHGSTDQNDSDLQYNKGALFAFILDQIINPSCYQRKLMETARTNRATLSSKPRGVTA